MVFVYKAVWFKITARAARRHLGILFLLTIS